MRHSHSIQYLRGLAASMVVLTHVLQSAKLLMDYQFVGAAGVDIFFVISGFLMWSITSKANISAAAFITDRVIRIVPLYWAVTLLLVGLAIATPLYRDLDIAPAHVLKSLLFIPQYDAVSRTLPVLFLGWTLNFEMAFYALFALALLAPRRYRGLIVAGPLVILPLLGLYATPQQPIGLFVTDPIILEFLGGVLLAVFFAEHRLANAACGWGLLGAGLVALLASALGTEPDGWRRLLLWGLPASAIVAGAIGLERGGRLPRWLALERLGDASYSLYLTHVPTLRLISTVLHPLSRSPLLVLPLGALGALAIALLVYAWIENPLRRFLRKRIGHARILKPLRVSRKIRRQF